MKIRAVSYLNVVPVKNNTKEKTLLLIKFIEGVKRVGDHGALYQGYDLQDCEVAMIQGWQHQRGKGGAHLMLREKVVNHQMKSNRFVCTADSNLFLYANRGNQPHNYLRYSFNGVFPDTAQYFDNDPDPVRWMKIKRDLNIEVGEHKTGRHILLCLQRNGGWSMGGMDIQDWIIQTVNKIRKYSDRVIIVRPHPGDKKAHEYLNHRYNRISNLTNVFLSDFGRSLDDDLRKCHAVVNHNSSSIVGPVIQGYPAYISDPDKSQCAEVTHHGFKDIENPKIFDRQKWLERISMFHWSFDELQNGDCWRHIREYI